MKKKLTILVLLLMLSSLMVGCGNTKKDEEGAKIPTTNAETNEKEEVQETKEVDWKTIYTKKINSIKENVDENFIYEYAITDIDDNGLNELLIMSGTDDTDYIIDVYTIYNNEPTSVGSFSYDNSELYQSNGYLTKIYDKKEVYNIKIEEKTLEEKKVKDEISSSTEYENEIEFESIEDFETL